MFVWMRTIKCIFLESLKKVVYVKGASSAVTHLCYFKDEARDFYVTDILYLLTHGSGHLSA